MTGNMFKLGEEMVMWGAKKETAVTLSTCKAENYALTLEAKEVMWFQRILNEAGMNIKYHNVPVHPNSQVAFS